MINRSVPVRPRDDHDKPCGLGEAKGIFQEREDPEPLEVHAADDDNDDDIDDLFGDEDPQQVGQGEVLELPDGSGEEDNAPRRTAPDPGEPTDEEIAEHRVDHIPYRTWCSH